MKKILQLIGVAALLATASVQADNTFSYANNAKLSGVTWGIGWTNLATPVVIDCRKQTDLALQLTLRGATTATNTLYFAPSVDGISYSTNASDRIAWQADSVSAVASLRCTNLTVGAYGYYVLYAVNASQSSTNTLQIGYKLR